MRLYLSLHCHHQNDSCVKMGIGVSHFNVSLINCEVQSHKDSVHSFSRERRAEAESNRSPCAYQPNALPLGQAGSHSRLSVQPSMSSSLSRQQPAHRHGLRQAQSSAGLKEDRLSLKVIIIIDRCYIALFSALSSRTTVFISRVSK